MLAKILIGQNGIWSSKNWLLDHHDRDSNFLINDPDCTFKVIINFWLRWENVVKIFFQKLLQFLERMTAAIDISANIIWYIFVQISLILRFDDKRFSLCVICFIPFLLNYYTISLRSDSLLGDRRRIWKSGPYLTP